VVVACRCDGRRGRPAHMTDKTGRRELMSSAQKMEKKKLSLRSLDVCKEETAAFRAFEVEFRTKPQGLHLLKHRYTQMQIHTTHTETEKKAFFFGLRCKARLSL